MSRQQRAWCALKLSLMTGLLGLLSPSVATADITFVHPDHLGSPIAYTDVTGNVIGREYYTPYGESLNPPTTDDTVSYTGHVRDGDTDLIYMQARYYDPVIGRFLSTDPVTFSPDKPMQFNRYWYANGNPYSNVDPDGRYVESAIEAASLAVGVDSLISNVSSRNYGAAGVDVVGIALDGAALALPGIPGGAGLGIKMVREGGEAASSAASAVKLEKQLASEQQLGEVMSGNAERIAGNGADKTLRDAPRLAAEHGGDASDYAKVNGGSYTARDGSKVETHAYQNVKTNEVFEPKTKIMDEGR